jgi:hypothetical protein
MIDPVVQTTFGSPMDYYKFEVLRDVISVKDAWESYYKLKDQYQTDLSVIHARTRSLFISLVAYLGRKWKGDKFDQTKKSLFGSMKPSEEILLEIFLDIQTQLDSDNITKLDTRKGYDRTRVETENHEFGH